MMDFVEMDFAGIKAGGIYAARYIFLRIIRLFFSSLFLVTVISPFSSIGSVTPQAQNAPPPDINQQIINVPEDAPSIQAAIDLAEDGDLVLVTPGVYRENLEIAGKAITLASRFFTTQDPYYIDKTIIEAGGKIGILVKPTAGEETRIIGFTIQNGDDGIMPQAKVQILNNRFIGNIDAIDYEGGGGICRQNFFENNSDDGIDLDGASEVTIEDNIILNNGDDGIEVRLHPFSGPTLNIVISNNVISGNGEDGIQLIDYPDVSSRIIRIERNLILNNANVGLGLLDNGDTKEDYRAASIPERILVVNNTFAGNPYAITGGDNLIALNNLFVRSSQIALKNVDGDSIAAYNLFWENGSDQQGSNVDARTSMFADPRLSVDYHLLTGSPAREAGVARFYWKGEVILDLPPSAYSGAAPHLGKYANGGYTVNLPIVGKSTGASVFPAIADARVRQSSPNTNFGSSTSLSVDGGSDPVEESYLRFDLTGVNKPIESARLRLFATTGTSNGPGIYTTSSDWTEDGITWNNRPDQTSGVIDDKASIQANTWVEYDLTSVVRGNGVYNFVLATDNSDGIRFSSREGLAPPQLLLKLADGPSGDPVLVGAGDIAVCGSSGDESTADLLDDIPGTVFTTGDNVYPDGKAAEFSECYNPSWGRHKSRTRPSPGNHDYHDPGAAGYYEYFGTAAGDPDKGYYSYDLGAWHIIALNSNLPVDPGSPQEQWLRQDLAAHPTACTLAYWHHPLFSSGPHGNLPRMQAFWEALYDAGADVVLNGHDHDYERFALQDPNGVADPQRGIREFVVGTGGGTPYPIINPIANSETHTWNIYGVLKLTLHPTSYEWEFVPEAGKSFRDSGSDSCVLSSSSTSTASTTPISPESFSPRQATGPSAFSAETPLLYAQLNASASARASTSVDIYELPDTGAAASESPITNPQPPSTLLPPGTSQLDLSVESSVNTTCAYSLGSDRPYAQMKPFDQGSGSTFHHTVVKNLNSKPSVVNQVYVRCASQPDYLLQLNYRSLSKGNPAYPRVGNLWGWEDWFKHGLAYMSRIDLWLGAAHATPSEMRALRALNPDVQILTNINSVDGSNLPDDYYLKDINGNRLEVWPGSFRLNMTKMYVAEYKAQAAYQLMLDSDLMFDGVFFDNFFTTQSWRKYDIHGNLFLVDSDENGEVDDPDVFDAAWKAGMFHEIEMFRSLMPHAIVSGHGMNIDETGIGDWFNGVSISHHPADVLEGEMLFAELWNEYHSWQTLAREPRITMLESSPPDQIAYGYDFAPWNKIPPSTLEFARTFYPFYRFGLALTLMSDGYFTHEFGDTWHGNDWWYDELGFNLGYPLGPAERYEVSAATAQNQLINGGFEDQDLEPWYSLIEKSTSNSALLTVDTNEKIDGAASARIDVKATAGKSWQIKLAQDNQALKQGVVYDVSFWAKGDSRSSIIVNAQSAKTDNSNYGLWHRLTLNSDWKQHTLSFVASETTDQARIQFLLGEVSGSVWLDEIVISARPPDIYLRRFTNGMVILNASPDPQEINIGPGYWRLRGYQAPLYERILDDKDASFSTSGSWDFVEIDSGELKAKGPFFHCWKINCHLRQGSEGEARWNLDIQEPDVYTITAWWPAAPQADGWNDNVTYEVISDGQVVASMSVDQRTGGDEWHLIAEVSLSPDRQNYVRVVCQGEAPCVADALHLRSRARYNDGSAVERVTLQPYDGIILANFKGPDLYLPLVTKKQ